MIRNISQSMIDVTKKILEKKDAIPTYEEVARNQNKKPAQVEPKNLKE